MGSISPENSEPQICEVKETDRQTCLKEMKVREAKKEQRKQGCGEEGEGRRQREKEASAQQEEGARPGRGIYIFFMILFNLTRLAAESVPSQVLLGGGCAQKADGLTLQPQPPPATAGTNLGDQSPLPGYGLPPRLPLPRHCKQARPEAQL